MKREFRIFVFIFKQLTDMSGLFAWSQSATSSQFSPTWDVCMSKMKTLYLNLKLKFVSPQNLQQIHQSRQSVWLQISWNGGWGGSSHSWKSVTMVNSDKWLWPRKKKILKTLAMKREKRTWIQFFHGMSNRWSRRMDFFYPPMCRLCSMALSRAFSCC